MLLYYIRHGDPIYDPDSLTQLGHEQAKALARRLSIFGVDELYSSTSNRAIETAKATANILGREIHTLDFLNENYLKGLQIPVSDTQYDWVWADPKYSQILAGSDVRALGDAWYSHPSLERFHFENIIEPINRQLDSFLESLGYEHDTDKGLYKITTSNREKRVAIFAHECMGKIVMSHLLDIPFPSYSLHFEMHTSGFTVIKFDDNAFCDDRFDANDTRDYARARVLTLSNDAHLYRDGISLEHRHTHLREKY